MTLRVSDLSCGYGRRAVVEHVSFAVNSGDILCLLGPNGVGKTTLFKTILGLLPAHSGTVNVDGDDIAGWSARRRAQTIAYVPQAHTPPFPFAVIDVVLMGRTSRLGFAHAPSGADRDLARATLEDLGMSHLALKSYTEISGGERQMVLIARALVQQPAILVLDEPSSNLDFGNQVRVLERINSLSESGIAIVMTTHFPHHVFLCSCNVALMGKNGYFLTGKREDVLSESRLADVFGVDVKIADIGLDDGSTVKTCVPLMSGPHTISPHQGVPS